METVNIAAFTPPTAKEGPTPYLSVNLTGQGVEITVRSGGTCSQQASITLSHAEFERLASRLYAYACTNGA